MNPTNPTQNGAKPAAPEYLVVGINLTPNGHVCGEYHAIKRANSGAEAAKLAHDAEESYGRLLLVIGVYLNAGANLRHSR